MQAFRTVMISILIFSPYAISWKLLDRRKGNLISRTGKTFSEEGVLSIYGKERITHAWYVFFTFKIYSVLGAPFFLRRSNA